MPDVLSCGHVAAPDGVGTGYAEDRETGERICYACADERQRAAMAGAPSFVGYISTDGRRFTTWSGGELGQVLSHGEGRGGWRGSVIHSWRVRTPDGAEWYGRNGGEGTVIKVRRAKRV